jgi:hypothetical protein
MLEEALLEKKKPACPAVPLISDEFRKVIVLFGLVLAAPKKALTLSKPPLRSKE